MVSTSDELLARATAETGLADFGADGWQEGFQSLVGAITVDLGDDPDAVALVEAIVVNRLARRLQVEDWYARHGAEAAAHAVEGPLIIVGTGRSGTTACHHLLNLDPQFRALRKWEIDTPVPPPVLGQEHLDPRRPQEVVAGEMHIATVDGPTEDRKILELMFHDDARPLALRTHSQWWLHADHAVAFPYHERILRLLQSHRPPHRWLLKSPDFVHYIEPVVAQYPDVKFVMTHREPLKVVPSACSVTVAGTRLRIPHWQYPDTFGRDMLENLATGTRRVIASPRRARRGPLPRHRSARAQRRSGRGSGAHLRLRGARPHARGTQLDGTVGCGEPGRRTRRAPVLPPGIRAHRRADPHRVRRVLRPLRSVLRAGQLLRSARNAAGVVRSHQSSTST